jgi:hypothetical protein
MKKYYSFAGIDLEIDIPDQWMYENDRYLAPFRVDSVEDPYVFQFEMVPELLPPTCQCMATTHSMRFYSDGTRYIGTVEKSWERGYAQVVPNGRHHRVLLKSSTFRNGVGVNHVLTILGAEHLMAQNGGFVFHCSYIAVNGKAILFTAPSGTGKSTQAELWNRLRGAAIHNGDRSAVRWQDGRAYACGVPFAGSSQICENVTLPLAAIVYLRQAPETTIRRLRGAESFRCLWEGCSVNTWDRVDVDRISETVLQVLTAVPVFELACTPDESAILALEGVLNL